MGPHLVVVTPPLLDAHPGFDAVSEPLQAEILVAELAVERFVGTILPRLPRIDEGGFDLRRVQPAQNGARHKLGAVVGAQVPRGAVDAHELGEHLDHPAGTNAAGHVDGQALSGELIDDRQAFQRLAIRARIEDEVVRPHVVGGRGRERTRPTRRHAAARASAGHLEAGLPPEPVGPVDSQHVAGALQEDPDAAVTVPRILPGQVTHRLERRRGAHR